MTGKAKKSSLLMALLPLACGMILGCCYGFPKSGELTSTIYYVQILMVILTIGGGPVLLKYVTRERCGSRYMTFCLARMLYLCVVAVVELCLYYFLCAVPMFYYLAIMTWLAMFFALPQKQEK